MRKNAPRKWIHAILDLLPLFVIPIFALMVRSDNGWEPISITTTEPIYYESNDVEDVTDLTFGNVYRWNDDFATIPNDAGKIMLDIEPNYIIEERFNISVEYNQLVLLVNSQGRAFIDVKLNNTYVYSISAFNQVFDFVLASYNQYNISLALPHISKTGSMYIKGYDTQVLYDDTDIGSQFLYSVYKPVNDYFNFNNLFNMQGIYDWLQLNLFGGNAPLPVLIVWNIIVYEFFIDLIFLLYSVFMFIIDFATHMIDSFTGRCR